MRTFLWKRALFAGGILFAAMGPMVIPAAGVPAGSVPVRVRIRSQSSPESLSEPPQGGRVLGWEETGFPPGEDPPAGDKSGAVPAQETNWPLPERDPQRRTIRRFLPSLESLGLVLLSVGSGGLVIWVFLSIRARLKDSH